MLPFESANYDEQVTRLTRAARAALRSYALESAQVQLILHVNNAVFEIRHGGRRYALRLHRHGLKRREWIVSELLWLEALRARHRCVCLVPCALWTVICWPKRLWKGLPGRFRFRCSIGWKEQFTKPLT